MPYITTVKQLTSKKHQNYTLNSITSRSQNHQTSVTLDGIIHTLDWHQIASFTTNDQGYTLAGGRFSLLIAGKSYEVFVRHIDRPDEKESQTYEIQIADQIFEVTVEDERTKLLTSLIRTGVSQNTAKIQAPMPGLIVNTLIEPGELVTAGQTVIILEAMKMENDLPSPIAGRIKEVKIRKGQTVDQGQLLVLVEGEQIS
jgi:biotin carboxyl carrier protein